MNIEQWPLDRIIPYARNPRDNRAAIGAVKGSIKEFGFRQPIVVDRAGVIVAGHTRYLAAQQLGLDQVPVHVATELTPIQIKAYRLADNRTADNATWDDDLLKLELQELQEQDFDLDLTGFDDNDLARLIGLVEVPEFKEYDETVANDVEMITCPSCGHSFPK